MHGLIWLSPCLRIFNYVGLFKFFSSLQPESDPPKTRMQRNCSCFDILEYFRAGFQILCSECQLVMCTLLTAPDGSASWPESESRSLTEDATVPRRAALHALHTAPAAVPVHVIIHCLIYLWIYEQFLERSYYDVLENAKRIMTGN